jgi:hypothetical protein
MTFVTFCTILDSVGCVLNVEVVSVELSCELSDRREGVDTVKRPLELMTSLCWFS